MKVVIVIPTYNEAENIGKLISALAEEFKKVSQHDCRVLVVDSNSPDGTADVVRDAILNFPFVHLLLERGKNGLGAAYAFGFNYAMQELKADVLIEMDADFQHDPKDVPRLIQAVDDGHDYVIGSRFTHGGRIPKDWALYRKFLSWGGNVFSKIVLGIFNVSDFTSGFKASRVKGFVDKIDFSTLFSGFAYKIDLLFRMHKLGARIKEIPITFGLRDRGTSKMERSNFLDSLKMVLSIRLRESLNFLKFMMVGFVGLFTDLLLSNLLRLIIFFPQIAASMAAFFAMSVTFVLNNFWSFEDRKKTHFAEILVSFIKYTVLSSVPIVFRYFFVAFITGKFGNTFLHYNGALFVSILFGLIWNYTVYSKIIWRKI